MNQGEVITGTSTWVSWWIEQRKHKLREQLSDTMSVNPFILPILFDLHDIDNFEELTGFIVGSHLMVGHNTGFGKLIDEKILPKVFGTQKLDKDYRKNNPPFVDSCFNEIDHVIRRKDGSTDLLSLKAGKWTIQLSMAQQLNHAFNEILKKYGNKFNEISVGVFYGTKETLTDKYDILRGINRGAKHNVIDLTDRVSVYAGREFWTWLNEGEKQTQDWILRGIIDGVSKSNTRKEGGALLEKYSKHISQKYQHFLNSDGTFDWKSLLESING
ncbi:MAG: restriction endonuclease [Alphaproteobacteria bacterium]|nr:restriction endonuclease [Alphaproteobacteria bacterium]QQS58640.1 MAG: restriction endonuclease [Alphaproteobacteria bacterium]